MTKTTNEQTEQMKQEPMKTEHTKQNNHMIGSHECNRESHDMNQEIQNTRHDMINMN